MAAKQRSNIPQFGNWDNNGNVPYTICFDKAKKSRGGKMINPNDPLENPDMFSKVDPSPPPPAPTAAAAAAAGPRPLKSRTRPEEPVGRGAVRPTPEQRMSSREDADFRQFSNSAARSENTGLRPTNESNYNGGRGQRPARSTRPSAGSNQSFENSPLHQTKVNGRGSGTTPAWEGRSYDGSSHGTPGRSRLRPSRGDESPERGTAIPRFGGWNESDPQSAENFTDIFNRVREERNTGMAGNVWNTPKHQSYKASTQPSKDPKKCCFPWW